MPTQRDPSQGDEYHHPDDVAEVVFATEDDRVLTVRQYPEAADFAGAVSGASDRGVSAEVADLPPAGEFTDRTTESDADREHDADSGNRAGDGFD
jgi:hypothetical protein